MPGARDRFSRPSQAAPPLDLAGQVRALVASDAPAAEAYRLPAAGSGVRAGARPRDSRLARHRGHPKHCPICQRAFGHFRPFGLDRRRSALCPGCGSLERHRFLWLYLRDTLRLPERRLGILHIAPEGCIRNRLSALPRIRYTGIDLYRPDAQVRMDVTRLDIPTASIDLVLCCHVLEHVERDRAALGELARVLRPGGRAIIMVPLDRKRPTLEDSGATSAAERMAVFGHPYHVRLCGVDYGDRIAEAGFAVRRVDSDAMSSHRRRYFRINKTSLFDCRLDPEPAHRAGPEIK